MKRSPTGKVIVLPVCHKHQLISDGQYTNWSYLEVPLPEAEEWGPFIMSITAHTRSESMTANVRWKIVFWWSVDGQNWSSPVDLFSQITYSASPVDTIQAEYNTVANFGLKMKFGLAVLNTASNTTIERAVVTAALAFKFFT